MALIDKLSAIGDAIRAKTGKTATMTLDEMPTEIASIQTGGGSTDPYEVARKLANRSITEYVDDKITTIAQYAFRGCNKLTIVDLPNVKSIATNAFYGTAVKSFYFPSVTSVESNGFNANNSLISINFPIATSIGTHCFRECYDLKTADFGVLTKIVANLFYNCRRLTAVILRSETKATLDNTSAFTNCRHFHGTVDSTYNPNGDKDGYIYVPAALIEDYKVATNWTTFASQFRALEDYTVDGTTTGALDESKI